MTGLLVPAALGAMLIATAGATPLPGPEAQNLDRFIARSGPVCAREPAARCVDLGFAYADADRDGGLSLAELSAVRRALRDWSVWRRDDLAMGERSAIGIGLVLVDFAGLPELFAGFDTNKDGRLTRAELLADVHLDERPLGAVLADPKSVDRAALARRVGAASPLLEGLLGGAMMRRPPGG